MRAIVVHSGILEKRPAVGFQNVNLGLCHVMGAFLLRHVIVRRISKIKFRTGWAQSLLEQLIYRNVSHSLRLAARHGKRVSRVHKRKAVLC